METKDKALEKAESAAKGMESRKLKEAARCLREGIGEMTTHLLDETVLANLQLILIAVYLKKHSRNSTSVNTP